jgi:cell division protein FtsW
MDKFTRRDVSLLGRWWWTVDHWILGATLLLIAIGVVLSVSASPCTAMRMGFNRYFFVKRHLFAIPLTLLVMTGVSLLSPPNIRKLAGGVFLVGLLALLCVFIFGHEVKGSKRWLILFGASIQPSEFVKPALLVVDAWLLAERQIDPTFSGIKLSLMLTTIVAVFTALQPDIGMTFIIMASHLVQIFIAGMPLLWVVGCCLVGCVVSFASYFLLPHVAMRIDSFLHPELGDPDQLYQVRQSIDAFHHGGWFGCGPGEGVIKRLVPDAHSDFVFSVAGEEYGVLACLFIVCLFAFIVIRAIIIVWENNDVFAIFTVTGLAVQVGLQAFINMSTAIRLIPTKGMTLPLVSYGGSSMIAVGISMGIILALTRKQYGWKS